MGSVLGGRRLRHVMNAYIGLDVHKGTCAFCREGLGIRKEASYNLNLLPNIYLITDVAVIGVSCFMLGASLLYFLLPYRVVVTRKEVEPVSVERWRKTLEGLIKEDERKIYQLMEENGVIFQSQLVEKSSFPKAKVSLILDKLEAKRLLKRRRRGMSNVVILKC